MIRNMFTIYDNICTAIAFPISVRGFLGAACGKQHGVTLAKKLNLVRAIQRNSKQIVSATGWEEQLMLAARVLSLPRDLDGDVIECGCFKGSSTASLSLACELTGRRLVVCDSFAGLPPIAEHDVVHVSEAAGRFETYAEGEYSGSLEEVQRNVRRYGAIEVCEFVKGYFEDTLRGWRGRAAMVFLDVDLHESLKTCLVNLWPQLSDYGYIYTHEAKQLEYVSWFYDKEFWSSRIGSRAPGLIGAGSGLPIGIGRSCGLGYVQKLPDSPTRDDDPRRRHFCGDPTRQREVAGPAARASARKA